LALLLIFIIIIYLDCIRAIAVTRLWWSPA